MLKRKISEAEISEAIEMWLERKHNERPVGDLTIGYSTNRDLFDNQTGTTFYVEANVERIPPKKRGF